MDWEKRWNQNPTKYGETEFLKQIGNTIAGIPISSDQFNSSISDINDALDITSNDIILDLCCGNGIRTYEISKVCNSIIGIDFSQPLITIANKYFKKENITYYCMSILDKKIREIGLEPFTKIYMYEALQHFDKCDFEKILNQIRYLSSSKAVVLLASIPDSEKLWDFWNFDARRRKYYLHRKDKKTDPLGTWWTKNEINTICVRSGFDVQFQEQNEHTHTAYYRFNVRLTQQENRE
jgi:2-polyprenyl-3-methyl-5-hydroxy-6-metoxy-1,4-benzoquinol methylase